MIEQSLETWHRAHIKYIYTGEVIDIVARE